MPQVYPENFLGNPCEGPDILCRWTFWHWFGEEGKPTIVCSEGSTLGTWCRRHCGRTWLWELLWCFQGKHARLLTGSDGLHEEVNGYDSPVLCLTGSWSCKTQGTWMCSSRSGGHTQAAVTSPAIPVPRLRANPLNYTALLESFASWPSASSLPALWLL